MCRNRLTFLYTSSVHQLEVFGWNNVGPASQTVPQHWANVSCYLGSGLSGHKASPV